MMAAEGNREAFCFVLTHSCWSHTACDPLTHAVCESQLCVFMLCAVVLTCAWRQDEDDSGFIG